MSTDVMMRIALETLVPKGIAIIKGVTAQATAIAAPVRSYLSGMIGWRGAFLRGAVGRVGVDLASFYSAGNVERAQRVIGHLGLSQIESTNPPVGDCVLRTASVLS